jgi:hypothetical protein
MSTIDKHRLDRLFGDDELKRLLRNTERINQYIVSVDYSNRSYYDSIEWRDNRSGRSGRWRYRPLWVENDAFPPSQLGSEVDTIVLSSSTALAILTNPDNEIQTQMLKYSFALIVLATLQVRQSSDMTVKIFIGQGKDQRIFQLL